MQDQPFSGRELFALFSERLDWAAAAGASGRAGEFEYRRLIGGVHDAAALLGLEALARGSIRMLDDPGSDLHVLREALPGPELIEARFAQLRQTAIAPRPEPTVEPGVIVLSGDPALGQALQELLGGRVSQIEILDTPAAAVVALNARPNDCTVLVVDEHTLPDDPVSALGGDLQPALQSGRLGMLLLAERMDTGGLGRAWRAGFAAIEPRGQSPAILERSVLLVVARCRAGQSGVRVLLIDEDELTRASGAALLTAAGVGAETLERLEDLQGVLAGEPPELILISSHMDGVPGREIAGMVELCALDGQPGIAFLARAADSARVREELHAAGFEVLYPQDGAARLVARVRRYAVRNGMHKVERARIAQREQKWDPLIEALNEHALVSETDDNGVIRHVNQKFCDVSGFSRNELVGQDHHVLNSGTMPEKLADMWRTISRGQVWHGSICNKTRDGKLFWVQTTIVPYSEKDGLRYRYYSIRTDITNLKEYEQTLSLRSQAIEASSDGITLADMSRPDYPLVEVNASFEHITGYARAEIIGRNCRFLQGADTDPAQIEEIRRAISRGRQLELTLLNYRKDGTPFWNELRLTPILSEAGKITHYLGVQHDVTRYVEAARVAREARQRLELAQRHVKIATWEVELGSREFFWTDNMVELLGCRSGEPAPSYDNLLAAIHPDDRQSMIDAVNDCVDHGNSYEMEYRVVWPDGTVRWLREHGALERSETGEPRRMIGVVQDFDKRKRALVELMAAREEADRANQAKSEFLSRMSHELRTPMNAVLGFAQLIQADPGLSEEHADNSEEIIKAGGHLLELINDVLDLSKVESGRIQVSIEPVLLAPLVDECMSLVEDMARRRSISIQHDVSSDLVVRADRTRLKQVLLNLLSNAIKYNYPKGRVWLRTERRQSDDQVSISVADTGPGIPAERIARLYEPFERLDAENSGVEGTGIGLTITRRLVELMGGAIRVESEPGRGSTFMVDLPLADDVTESELEERGKDTGESVGISGPATVLYVEDNPSNMRLMARALGRQRHIHLLTAHNAELGIELAVSHRPDLILLDINLPGLDGYEVLGVIRAEASLREVPVVAVSANALPHDLDRARKAGFSEYLTKPLDLEKLTQTIARFIEAGEASADE